MLPRRTLFTVPLLAALPAQAKAPLAATPLSRADKWWQARHEAKLAEIKTKKPNLIFLGDSITQDWEHPEYAQAWQRFYGDRNAVNLGFKGDATSHLLWRIQNGETSGIAPKAAVVLIGANNMGRLHWPAEDTLAGFDAILTELHRRLPATKILLLSVLPSERNAWVTATTNTINKALPAHANGATFVDVTHVFAKDGRIDKKLFADPFMTPPEPALHPSPAGQILLSQSIEPHLAALLGDRPHK